MKTTAWWLAIASSLMVGCGGAGSGSASSTATDETGTVQIALTDAEEDFLTYQVEVLGITLVREDGTEVDVLPATTEVDFVQYQQLSELFMVAAIPAGHYRSVLVNLDYADADIVVQDSAGVSYSATVVDSHSTTISTLEVSVDLGEGALNIGRNSVAGLTLDLDLAASNEVLSYDPAVVEVEPFLMVVASQDTDREHRVRGQLISSDTDTAEITLAIRPMRHRSGEFGDLVVAVTETTRYDIDGIPYTGSDGLALIAALDAATPIVSYGSLDNTGTFTATEILTGASVDWSGDDVVKGIVTARSGNVLTLNGAVVERSGHDASFASMLEVTLSEETGVTGRYDGDSTIADISVGQSVLVSGSVSTDDITKMDASTGYVRMKLNRLSGSVTTTAPLSLDLLSINSRNSELFDFSGTADSRDNDADPTTYELQTATLDVTNLATGDWVAVAGYPTAFGAAIGDFDAVTVNEISFASSRADYVAHWSDATTMPVSISNDTLVLDVTDASERLRLHGIPRELVAGLEVAGVTATVDKGHFAVQISATSTAIYLSYSDFLLALANALEGTEAVSHLSVQGQFDDSTGILDASSIMVRFGESSRQ
ncbi:DUF4382 domain-containing protein [Oceanobacter antarcticus]|uniref:DUF4382 domain-containing protein n=1 Tax=Oceanobacter antarcticus TaxID=3133425 RepID=A0ABW8NIG8_9GAMM